jgi:hypothetical protein
MAFDEPKLPSSMNPAPVPLATHPDSTGTATDAKPRPLNYDELFSLFKHFDESVHKK